MGGGKVHSRVLFYRDDRGHLHAVTVEAEDPAEVERVARLFRRVERASAGADDRYAAKVTTFTDARIEPNDVQWMPEGEEAKGGLPWEGPRFDFALLLGESPTWSGPVSMWLMEGEAGETVPWDGKGRKRRCRFCSHLREMPLVACCLNGGCSRTGRDLAIPRPTGRDLERRVEKLPAPTKLPAPKADKSGRVLAGGLKGKR